MCRRRFGSSCAWRTSPRGPHGQQGMAAGGIKGKRKTQDSAAQEQAWSHGGVFFLTSPGLNNGVGALEKAGFPGSHASVMPRAPRRRAQPNCSMCALRGPGLSKPRACLRRRSLLGAGIQAAPLLPPPSVMAAGLPTSANKLRFCKSEYFLSCFYFLLISSCRNCQTRYDKYKFFM